MFKSRTRKEYMALPADHNWTPCEQAEELLLRLEFADLCSENSDNSYYTSGRKQAQRDRINAARKTLTYTVAADSLGRP